jgi:hypothetical protein
MRVVVLADDLFALRERAMLRRLEVGLADESVRVVHAIPERSVELGSGDAFTKTVTYSDTVMPMADRFRAATLARSLDTLAESEGPGDTGRAVDVVHVFGGGVWSLGRRLAQQTGAGLVLEVWRMGLTARATAMRDSDSRDRAPATGPLFLAPDPAIERALRAEGPGISVRLAPWGVYTPSETRQILDDDRVPSIMVVGTGRDPATYAGVMRGLAAARKHGHDFVAFMDARAAQRARVWPLAHSLGLLDRLSLIEELEGRRDLVLLGDMLVHPDHGGEQRSIVLDAMAAGMVVVAAADPAVSVLADGLTARLVRTPDPHGEAWAAAISGLLADRTTARTMARMAHDHVAKERKASAHVRAVLDAYAWTMPKVSLAFRQPT